MTARIQPVDNPSPEVRALLERTLVRDGRPLNIFTTLAHAPLLLRRVNALGGAFLASGGVPARERELVVLRVGWRCRSVYEFGQHQLIGQAAGLSEDEVRRTTVEPLDDWPAGDAALLRLADDVCRDATVHEGTWQALAARFAPAELLELVLLAGYYAMISAFLNAVGVELDPGVPDWPTSREDPAP
jgi:alkylhydroperoxidase family enzyme